MARDYDHLFKLLIIGDSGECWTRNSIRPAGGRGWVRMRSECSPICHFFRHYRASLSLFLISSTFVRRSIQRIAHASVIGLRMANALSSFCDFSENWIYSEHDNNKDAAVTHAFVPLSPPNGWLISFLCHKQHPKRKDVTQREMHEAWTRRGKKNPRLDFDYDAIWWASKSAAFKVFVRSRASS